MISATGLTVRISAESVSMYNSVFTGHLLSGPAAVQNKVNSKAANHLKFLLPTRQVYLTTGFLNTFMLLGLGT